MNKRKVIDCEDFDYDIGIKIGQYIIKKEIEKELKKKMLLSNIVFENQIDKCQNYVIVTAIYE